MTNQMASRFRVKKLSPKHPLPVLRESQLPDLDEVANLQRAVPQIETGVEKDEEEEHDLQAAISAARAAVTTGESVAKYIPTPDASRQIDDGEYSRVYNVPYKQPGSLIRFSMTVEELSSSRYVLDEQDAAFLADHNRNKDHKLSDEAFEHMMDLIESGVTTQMPHLNLDPSQTPDYAELLKMVPDLARTYNSADIEPVAVHWRARRVAAGGKPVIPDLLFEDILKGEMDPYVCFRRRETKPVRKTRRTDQQSLERLRKLRNEMEKARNLLEMVLRREKIRKESLVQEHAVFDKRCQIREHQRLLGIRDEEALMPIVKKKRKLTNADSAMSSTTIKIQLKRRHRDDASQEKSPMQLAIEAELARKREEDADYEDVSNCSYQPFPLPLPLQFFQSFAPTEGSSSSHAPRFRKRMGRGGRVFIDRIGFRSSDVDDRYRFDPDNVSLEDEIDEIDADDERFMHYRTTLLSHDELSALNKHTTTPPPAPAAEIPTSAVKGEPASNTMAAAAAATSAVPMKRQNSRSRMTPQQAAIAMTNGMIAANLSAAMNGVSVQMTRTPNGNGTPPLQQPTPPHKSSASPSPQLAPLQTYTARIS